MFVYVIVNSETQKIYVGQHKGRNLQKYLHQKISHALHGEAVGSHLYSAMRKYPRNVWSIHSLISDLQTREECDHWETVLIGALSAQHPDVGYNICPGGEGAGCGNTHGQGNKGRVFSNDARKRMSEAAKRRFADSKERAYQQQRLTGVIKPPRSAEHCRHLSESRMGHKPSAEQLLHQSLAQKGKPKPPRTAEHIQNNAEAVRAYWRDKKAKSETRLLVP